MPTYTVAREQSRRTPPWLYAACCDALGVATCVLDAFASADNALCATYYDAAANGLVQPWVDPTFANPPFKLMTEVVKKAIYEIKHGCRSVLIGPAGCSQAWFHALWPHAVIYWPTRRLVYLDLAGQATGGAMQDTAVYVLDGESRDVPEVRILEVRR